MNRQPEFQPIAALPAGAVPYAAPFVAPGQDEPERGVDLAATLRHIWSAIWRNWLLIAAILGACLLLGIVATMLMTPRYQAVASIQIDQETAKVLGTEDSDPGGAYQDADRFLETQVDVLKSRLVAEQVVDSLGLARNDAFLAAMHARPGPAAHRRAQVLGLLAANLAVTLPRTSRVVAIGFRSPDPATAQKVANSFATNFIMLNIRRKFDQTAYARSFLETQLVGAKQRLEDSERANR